MSNPSRSGCAKSATTKVGVARPARPANCELTMISHSDVYPGAKYAEEYEPIDLIRVDAKTGAQPTDPEVKDEVRKQACAVGAELIALGSSSTQESAVGIRLGQDLTFMVYARKITSAPQKY